MVCPEEGKQRAVGQVVSSCNRKHCGACSVPQKPEVNVQIEIFFKLMIYSENV